MWIILRHWVAVTSLQLHRTILTKQTKRRQFWQFPRTSSYLPGSATSQASKWLIWLVLSEFCTVPYVNVVDLTWTSVNAPNTPVKIDKILVLTDAIKQQKKDDVSWENTKQKRWEDMTVVKRSQIKLQRTPEQLAGVVCSSYQVQTTSKKNHVQHIET
jgi:hypothetical protein